ncbi:hypothetical protein ACQGAO_31090 [Rhodococcus sp. 1.20]|jgi:putative transposase|uniref:hypothetical protein n=1 Tax=Rhodococcus qingshengii TaxID=334542 RepID=UPI0035DA074A
MATTELNMALWRRNFSGHAVADGLIHHSDAGSQCTSIVAAIGSTGDARDNALAEPAIGLFSPRPSPREVRS